MIKIGINASFARKEASGIGQVTINFLKELAVSENLTGGRNDKMEFILYLEEALPKTIKLPDSFRQKVFLPFWRRDDLMRKIMWEKWLLPKKAQRDGCDFFLSLYQCPTIMPENIFHIMLVHDIIPKLFPHYLNNSRKRAYWNWTEKSIRAAQKILTVSARTEKDLIQHLGIEAQKISVNHIDCDAIYKKHIGIEKISAVLKKYYLKPGYIYTGGGLEVRKNTESVVRAYKQLLESNRNQHFISEMPKLVISGKLLPHLAPLVTDVERLTKELNLSKHVEILDHVAQEDLPALYSQASFFVYPSHYEGFGIPVLEAMACGCPVITAKTSSLPEVGLDNVLYCRPDDVCDIAMVMKNLLINRDLREMLRLRGKERAQIFSWNKFACKIINCIIAKDNK